MIIESGEASGEILGVEERVVDEIRGIGEMRHVLAVDRLLGEHVVDQSPEERDVAPGSDRQMDVGERGCSGETRIDVDHGGAALSRLQHKSEPDRVILRHVGAHDHDAVALSEVLQEGRGASASQSGAQTGHRGGVSYPRLVLHRDNAQTGREEFLDQVVLFIVEGGPAEVTDREGAIH